MPKTMNSATVKKIETAADFLIQFRKLPRYVQDLVRPNLNEPQQTALKVLDCCRVMSYRNGKDDLLRTDRILAVHWRDRGAGNLHAL
jgi:hypothetical protein